jgi:hypothetical protein
VPEAKWIESEVDNLLLRLKMCTALPPNCISSFYSDKNRGNFTYILAVQFAALSWKVMTIEVFKKCGYNVFLCNVSVTVL